MSQFKYVHLLWANELKFNRPLVEMINNDPAFDPSEHLFVTQFGQVKEELSAYSNVILDKNGSQSDLVNRYAESADWLFSHGLPEKRETLRIKRKYLKKIIWRTWGGSRQKGKWDGHHIIRSIITKGKDCVYYLFYKQYYGKAPIIGIANTVDVIDLEQWNWNGDARLMPIGYVDRNAEQVVSRIKTEERPKNIRPKIMVGHQGTAGENHVAIVKELIRYKEDFDIYLPLSYGNKPYIEAVKAELASINDPRIHVMDQFMPFGNYLSFLASVDVAIIDEKSSMALGNLCFLLYFGKKLFLNENGVIKKAFEKDNLPYSLTCSIKSTDFSELVRPVTYPEPVMSDLVFGSYSGCVQRWVEVLDYLEGLSSNGRR